ncbi:MAG: ABC transporter permease subunit [Xanthomonadaceae bacterium]|jgi:putrescine transport system permease protein|nr:ABC transporter permease subunit [Xanthomonadaceae bacterium]
MKPSRGSRLLRVTILTFGFAFLYLPIVIMMVYSFNSSRLATVWAGFSTKWYGELFNDQQILDSLWVSLRIAFWTATAATVIGTLAAIAMTRFRRFPGKTLFGMLVTAPMVMPEVIIGLAILLMLVSVGTVLGTPSKGMVPIWIAHVTLTVSFVTVVISARLVDLDKSLEEAAMDLGANRLKVFIFITLPLIAPSLVSGWLLAFTLSLDDVVIASFLTGPDSTTLPVKVFSFVRMGINPKINALATLMVLAVVLGGAVAAWLMVRREQRQRKNRRTLLLESKR